MTFGILGTAVISTATVSYTHLDVYKRKVIISCLLPARLAGKVSPVEALRYTDAAPGSRKKEKKGRRGASLAAMAWANLWRNKKRTFLRCV